MIGQILTRASGISQKREWGGSLVVVMLLVGRKTSDCVKPKRIARSFTPERVIERHWRVIHVLVLCGDCTVLENILDTEKRKDREEALQEAGSRPRRSREHCIFRHATSIIHSTRKSPDRGAPEVIEEIIDEFGVRTTKKVPTRGKILRANCPDYQEQDFSAAGVMHQL